MNLVILNFLELIVYTKKQHIFVIMANSNIYIKSGIWRKTDKPVKGELSLDDLVKLVAGVQSDKVYGDLIPALDNTYVLGNNQFRWKDIRIGQGSLYITDTVTGIEVEITVTDGVLYINGAAQIQVNELIANTMQLNNSNGDAYYTINSDDGITFYDGDGNTLYRLVNDNGVGKIIFGGGSSGYIKIDSGLFIGEIQYRAQSSSIKPLSYNTSTGEITYDSSTIPFTYTSQVPAHSYGVAGNVKNMFTYDGTYFYICTADYQGDAINIWKRIAWTAGTW